MPKHSPRTRRVASKGWAVVLTAALLSTAHLAPANAVQSAIKQKSDWFKTCKALKAAGEHRYSGVASGWQTNQGGPSGTQRFTAKVCFKSQSACENWKRNVRHEIVYLDELRYARCRAEG